MNDVEFVSYHKIARLKRSISITEKIDGTNAQIHIRPAEGSRMLPGYDTQVEVDGQQCYMRAGSRKRWISPDDDNYGFARWAYNNAPELAALGIGTHFGEWWGNGIQRNYSQTKKIFSLFNTRRWGSAETRPSCCDVVPVLYEGEFHSERIKAQIRLLAAHGSVAAPGFMEPEGVVVCHLGGLFKQTIENDDVGKGQ